MGESVRVLTSITRVREDDNEVDGKGRWGRGRQAKQEK